MKNFFKHEFSVKECPIGEYKPDRPENEQWNAKARDTRKFSECYVKVQPTSFMVAPKARQRETEFVSILDAIGCIRGKALAPRKNPRRQGLAIVSRYLEPED